jgi:hypothetical protein
MYDPEPHIVEATEKFLSNELTLEEFTNEIDYWLHFTGNVCDLCKPNQMCTIHFERYYAGAW